MARKMCRKDRHNTVRLSEGSTEKRLIIFTKARSIISSLAFSSARRSGLLGNGKGRELYMKDRVGHVT